MSSTINKESLRTVLVTDCGSTTTKALLFQKTGSGWRHSFRGEAPTTVEEPVADVTVGALNAFGEIQELSQRKILSQINTDAAPFEFTSNDPAQGIDLYLSTSSAGGGLQMMVAGVVSTMSAESAERAALGAGAIVMDTISADDGRAEHERIEKIRHIRPDIVLITGGVDGGSKSHVVEIAENILSASPRPRFGDTLRLPVIYAGNCDAAAEVKEILSGATQISVVPNVRPTLETENLGPAREAIHEFFLSHVMSHSPGYGKLLSWTPVPVMPTPAAVGVMVENHARADKLNALCVDIGGATTDVFSVFADADNEIKFNRTVSANLGMSYSIANVLIEAGTEKIRRWLPYSIDPSELRDRLRNKMIRPTSIPQTIEDLWLEQAVCREALRLSLQHHRSLAVGLSGRTQRRSISDIFAQKSSRYELVDLKKLDLVIGSGGVLSHAPSRMSALLMMLDGFGLEGLTQVAVDSVFMMPHLGVFSEVHPEAAREIFLKDCLVNVGYTVVPTYPVKNIDEKLAEVFFNSVSVGFVERNKVSIANIATETSGSLKIVPINQVDVGKGPGEIVENMIDTGQCGVILDGRNRPILPLSSSSENIRQQQDIFNSLGLMEK